MAKRFCDTEIFKKKWFRSLPTKYKTLFFFLFTNCDLAGVWEVDFEQVSFFVDKTIDEAKTLQLFEKHIIVIENGKKWFLKDFIPFQYGDHLNEKSPVHKKIIDILSKYSINGDTLYNTLYDRVSDTAQEEDKDKEVEEAKEEEAPKLKRKSEDLTEYTDEQKKGFTEVQKWINEKAPRVAKMKEPLKLGQYLKIKERYAKDLIGKVFMSMHNWGDLTKRQSAYLTFLSFAEREEKNKAA